MSNQRWRTIGATKMYNFPKQKIVLQPARPERHHIKSTIDDIRDDGNVNRPEGLKTLFDKVLASQKQDLVNYTTGHLNPTRLNKDYHKQSGIQKPKVLFGKERNLELGEMIDILREFDTVHQVSSPVVFEKTTMKKPKVEKAMRRFLPAAHLSLTKNDQYRAMAQVDTEMVKPGQNIRHADKGKVDKLREYRTKIEYELAINKCPPVGPDVKRLQIYSACFEKIIEDFTTYGPLLADIKVFGFN